MRLFSYYAKKTEKSNFFSESYLSVNNFGYCEGRTDMRIQWVSATMPPRP